jgi:uncharacterized protein (DUF2236 family)
VSVVRFAEVPERLRARVNQNVRRAIGIDREPPSICLDPANAYVPLDAVARIVHADLPAMLIGGLGSLFFQMLHPYSMAGVAQHSRYREDALGRVLQTANFISATTFGTSEEAHAAIAKVLAIHEFVRGVADDGVAYHANDPHLLAWVHAAGTRMFLSGYQQFGPSPLSPAHADAYVSDVARTARDLGAETPPRTVAELDATLDAFRPELRLTRDAQIARDFIIRGVVEGPLQRASYRLLVDGAFSLIPPWACEMLEATPRARAARFERPATLALNAGLRFVVTPPSQRDPRAT